MVFSLLAYFFSMVTAFALVMAALIGFGDSQLRSSRMHYPAVATFVNANRDVLESEKAKEAQKAEEARKAAEAQRAAEAREDAKKLARAKLLRERKQAMLAGLRQQQGENSLAFGYAEPFSDGAGLFSFAPRYDR